VRIPYRGLPPPGTLSPGARTEGGRARPFGNKFVNYTSIFGSHELANRSTLMAREEEEEEEEGYSKHKQCERFTLFATLPRRGVGGEIC